MSMSCLPRPRGSRARGVDDEDDLEEDLLAAADAGLPQGALAPPPPRGAGPQASRPAPRRAADEVDGEDDDDDDEDDGEKGPPNGPRREPVGQSGYAMFLAFGGGQNLGDWVAHFDKGYLARYFGHCCLLEEAEAAGLARTATARASIASASAGAARMAPRISRATRTTARAADKQSVTALSTGVYAADDTGRLLGRSDLAAAAAAVETKVDHEDPVARMADSFLYVAFANDRFARELLSEEAEGSETRAAFEAAHVKTRIIIELDRGLDAVRQYDPDLMDQMPYILPMQSRELKSIACTELLAVKLVLAAHELDLPAEMRAAAFDDTVSAIQSVWRPASLDKAILLRGLRLHADVILSSGRSDLFHRIGLYMLEEAPGWLNELLDATMYPDASATSRALDINVLYTIHMYVCWDPVSKAMYERVSGLFSSSKDRELNVSKRAVRALEADDYRCARRIVALALRHKGDADAQVYVATSLTRLARRAASKQLAAFAMPYALQTVDDMVGSQAGASLFELMQILVAKKVVSSTDKARFKRHQASIALDAAAGQAS